METRYVPVSTFIEGAAEGDPLFRIQWNLGQYSRFDIKTYSFDKTPKNDKLPNLFDKTNYFQHFVKP